MLEMDSIVPAGGGATRGHQDNIEVTSELPGGFEDRVGALEETLQRAERQVRSGSLGRGPRGAARGDVGRVAVGPPGPSCQTRARDAEENVSDFNHISTPAAHGLSCSSATGLTR
ncbi:hypothetical protein MVI01_72930 [Myxococcus virescens]|uniref:Uncharacterized protein n=1 Tax=Myxococcus virescens TaxID=83456 RepID=A0A511HSN5_9BACT|nr:hypothetical protein MVI01_72930 [Myxococcus virescens]